MTIKNKNIGDKNRKISGKKIMLVTALLSGGVTIRVNNHINNSFGHAPKEVINFDLTLESTDVLIDDTGVFYVGEGTPIDNFNIYDFVTILDESGNVIADKDVTLEWDVKEYFEGTTFGTKGEYLITITATTTDGRMGELEYKLVVKEGHVFEEIKEIEDIEVNVNNNKDILDFQEHFRVLNSTTGADTGAPILSTLVDEDLQTVGTTQVIFYTELDGIKFTNSVHISVVDTIAPSINLADSFEETNGYKWNQKDKEITISELDKTLEDFNLDEFATAYDASGEYEMSWNFNEVMKDKLDQIISEVVTITAIDSSGNESTTEIFVNISTVEFVFKDGITEIAFELYHDAKIEEDKYKVGAFYDVYDASGNLVADHRISWTLTEEMVRELGEYKVTIEVLDDNDELIGAKGVDVQVRDTIAPEATLLPNVNTTFTIEVDQNLSADNIFMYLKDISGIDEIATVSDNSGLWGYRFIVESQELSDSMLRNVGMRSVEIQFFDYDKEGNELNYSRLNDDGGFPINLILNIVDTTGPVVNIVNDVIDLEIIQNATKEMIEITNYAEINDNSGSFTWDLRIKGSPSGETFNYRDMLGKITQTGGVALELVVTDATGNVTYSDILLIVSDTQAPVFEVIMDEETININPSASELESYRDIDSYVSVSDNSGKVKVDWDFDQVVQVKVSGDYYVTITASDDAGNETYQIIKFIVSDTEVPTIIVNTSTIEIEANEYRNSSEFEFDENLNNYITVSDNSGITPTVTFDYSNVDFGEIGDYDVIITAIDAVGNESTNTITIKTIAGNPKISVVEDQIIENTITIENDAFKGIKIEVIGGKIVIERAVSVDVDEVLSHLTMDNLLEFLTISGETIESSTWDLTSLDVTQVGTYPIQLNVTNNFGKITNETIEFSVVYEYDTLIKVSGDNFINVEIDESIAMDEAWFKSNFPVGNYIEYRAGGGTANIVWSATSFANIDFTQVGTYILSAAITDGHNETENVSLSLNVIDTTGPTITIDNTPGVIEVNDKNASDYAIADFVTVTDNSGITPTLSWNLVTQVDFSKEGTYVVTIKAVDAYGNETTKDITFEVEDTQPPTITINPGMGTQTIEINSRDESQFNINSFVTAVDNSGIAPELEWNIEDVQFDSLGTYTVIIKATDEKGNESNEVTITFEIVDTVVPIIDIDPSGLEELKLEINDAKKEDFADWIEDYVTVSDNSNENIMATWNIDIVDFGTTGAYRVTIKAEDSSGNEATIVVTFVVSDTTAPTITLKDDMELTEYEVFGTNSSNLNIDDFVNVSDSSGITSLSWNMDSVNFDRVGTYVVTIRAVDTFGNVSIQDITIEVQDTEAPIITITRPEILISTGKNTASDFDVNDFATVTDNYDKSVVLIWDIDSAVDFDNEGVQPVTISAVDSSGNIADEQIVTFKVERINIEVTEDIPFEIEVSQTVDSSNISISDYFTITENNGLTIESISWNLTDDMLRTYGTHGVTITVTLNGEDFDVEVTLRVTDTTGPVLDTQHKLTETIELGNLTEYDNLTPEDFATFEDNSGVVIYSWDLDKVVEQTVAGTYQVTIIVSDVAGNTTDIVVEIIVEDSTSPILEFNDSFDRNNIIWSKGTSTLSILAGDKTQTDINLWDLITATEASTTGLTISWDLVDLDTPNNHSNVTITVTDASGNVSTETIYVNVLRATPILNNFTVDSTYTEVIVDVDITNLNQAISGLAIILLDEQGNQVDQHVVTDLSLDGFNIHNVFNVNSNSKFEVVLEYTYATFADNSNAQVVEEIKNVETLGYSESDILGTVTNTRVSQTEIYASYEFIDSYNLTSQSNLIIREIDGTLVDSASITSDLGNHTFTNLNPNKDYKIEIEVIYNFKDGKPDVTFVVYTENFKTFAYSSNDVILNIGQSSQSTSTVSIDYNTTDVYGLIPTGGLVGKIYNAGDMSLVEELVLTSLNGTVVFSNNLNANTSYIVLIEATIDLKDGTTTSKDAGTQVKTDSYDFSEIIVNISNVIIDYNNITFDYEVFDPSGLLVANMNGNKLQISINDQIFELPNMSGTMSLDDPSLLNDVYSGTTYNVQIHFEYDLKDGNGNIKHETDLYGFVETTIGYDVDNDLTLTSHNLGSDTDTIYVEYSLRNLNFIGDMNTLALIIRDENNNEEKIYLSSIFNGVANIPLEGSFEISSINGNILEIDTAYEVEITIDYDLKDGNGVQTNLLLLETTQIKTQDIELTGYNVITTVDRGYNFLDVDFEILNTSGYADLLDTFKIALLDENGVAVSGFDYINVNAATGQNNFRFENLLSDKSYTIVYRVDNPIYVSGNGENEFVDISRNVSTRTYNTDLVNVEYDVTKGYTYLSLKNINITDDNEKTEGIDYSQIVVMITYTNREGIIVTQEVVLGNLTEVIFSNIQSDREIEVKFRIDYDLKDGNGIQDGTDAIIRSSVVRTESYDFTFVIENDEVVVTGLTPGFNKNQLVIYQEVEGYPVKYVKDDAFYSSNISFSTIVLPKTIEIIGINAFRNVSLSEVKFENINEIVPGSVYAINDRTTSPLLEIQDSAFRDNVLTSFDFGIIASIGESTFRNNLMTEIVLTDNINFVGAEAFANNGTTKLTTGELLKTGNFGSNTFTGNQINELTIGNVDFRHDSLGSSELVFASTGLTLRYADSAVGTIVSESWRADNLYQTNSKVKITNLYIGNGVNIVGNSAFIGNDLNEVVIGDSVTKIEDSAFKEANVDNVTLGISLETIEQSAFERNNISTISLPDSLNNIGNSSFANNIITELEILNSISQIGNNVFENNNIAKLTIGETLTYRNFGNDTFVGNEINELILNNIEFSHNSFGTSEKVFASTGYKLVLTDDVEGQLADSSWEYSNASNTSNVKIIDLVIGNKITAIGNYSFLGNNLNSVVIGDAVQTIGVSAFDSTEMASLTLGSSITSLGNRAFADNNLTAIDNFPQSLETIGDGAFINNRISVLVLPNTVQTIGVEAFRYNQMTDLTLSDGIEPSALQRDAFSQNAIAVLQLGNPEFTNTSFGESQPVFSPNGIDLVYTDNASGAIPFWGWDPQRASANNPVEINTLDLGGVNEIGERAFNFSNIKELVITSSITKIEQLVFANNSIDKITIEPGVTADAFGVNIFALNDVKEVVLGDVSFTNRTFGTYWRVFDSAGVKVSYSDGATGEIPANAWNNNSLDSDKRSNITQLTLSDGITSIGNGAFANNGFDDLSLTKDIETIGNNAFENSGLRTVSFNDALETIGNSSFVGNTLSTVDLSNTSVRTIGSNAFESVGLSNLSLGNSTVSLGYRSFASNQLTAIGNFPQTLEIIGDGAFISNNINVLSLPNTVQSIGIEAFRYNQMTNLTLADGILPSALQRDAFSQNAIAVLQLGNPEFTNTSFGESQPVFSPNGIDLVYTDNAAGAIPFWAWDPDRASANNPVEINTLDLGGVNEIGERAFNFSNMTELVITSSITKIDDLVFANNSINKITVEPGVKASAFGNNIFALNNVKEVVLGDVSITNRTFGTYWRVFDSAGVKVSYTEGATGAIPANAWNNNILDADKRSNITDLTLHDGITEIGNSAFVNNDFDSLVLTKGIKTIGNNAFENNGIQTVSFNDALETIGSSAFEGNTISTIDLSNTSVETIGNSAFKSVGVQTLTLSDSVTTIGDSAFESNNISNLVLTDSVRTLGSSVFKNTGLSTVTFNDGLTTIGQSAFEGNSLTDVILFNSVVSLGASAFKNNDIVNYTLSNQITVFNTSVFENNEIDTLVLLPHITDVFDSAFAGNNISSMNIPTSIDSVGSNAFKDNDITELTIADGLSASQFGSNSFENNKINILTVGNIDFKHNTFGLSQNVFASTGFELVITNGAVGQIIDNAWEYSTASSTSNVKLTNVSIGDGITRVGNSSFFGNDLSTVVIGSGVETIGKNAFDSTGVSNLTLGESIISLGVRSFANNKLTEIKNFPQTLEIIGDQAFISNNINVLSLPNTVTTIGFESFRYNQMTNLTLADGILPSALKQDAFSQNAISVLQLGNPEFTNTSFGESQPVFSPNGVDLVYTDNAAGAIPFWAWDPDRASANNPVEINTLDLGGVNEIGERAFNFSNITELVITSSITKIDDLVFANNSIDKITVEPGVKASAFGNNIFALNNVKEVVLGDVSLTNKTFGTYWRVFDAAGTKVSYSDGAVGVIPANAWNNNNVDSDKRSQVKELTLGAGITGIGNDAFANNDFDNLVLGRDLETIGNNAFQNNGIQTVTFNDSLRTIGSSAFTGNTISNVDMSNSSVETIGSNAFDGISVRTLLLSDDTETIGNFAFANNSIANVVMGSSVETIGTASFKSSGINSLTLNEGLETIGNNAFEDNNLGSLVLPSTVESTGVSSFKNTGITNLTLNEGLSSIGNYSFANNEIPSLQITSSVRTIGQYAFDTNKIDELVLGKDILSIGEYAFTNNEILKITTEEGLTADKLGFNLFAHSEINELILGDVSFTAGSFGLGWRSLDANGFSLTYTSGVTGTVPSNAWNSSYYSSGIRSTITSLTLSEGITSIGSSGFANNNFNALKLPSSLQSIGSSGFASSGIQTIDFNDSLETIGDSAFTGNTLPNIDLSNTSVETIGNSAFLNTAFTTLSLNEGLETIGNNAFENGTIGTLVLPSTVEAIGNSTFKNTKITSLTLNDGLTSIGNNAFETNSLTSLVLTDDIETIGSSAFRYAGITSGVTFNDNLITIGSYAFANNTIQNVDLKDSVKTIGSYAFYSSGLTTLTLRDGLSTIGSLAFASNSLSEVTIPGNVSSVGTNSFSSNSILKLTIGEGTKASAFGTNVFSGNRMSDVTMGDAGFTKGTFASTSTSFSTSGVSLTYTDGAIGAIPSSAFSAEAFTSNPVVITSLNLGTGITGIGDRAFNYSKISDVNIPGNVQTIGTFAFANNNVSKLTLGPGIKASGFGSNVFAISNITDLYLGDASFTMASFGTGWRTLSSSGFNLTFTAGSTGAIPSYAWSTRGVSGTYVSTVKSVTFAEGITGIGSYAFDLNDIREVTIPSTVTSVGTLSFANNVNMNKVTVKPGVVHSEFGYNVFALSPIHEVVLGDVSLTNNTFGTSWRTINSTGVKVTYEGATGAIPSNAWNRSTMSNAASVTQLTLCSGITSIGSNAFANNNSFSTVTIPTTVTSISSGAFYGNSPLKTVVFNSGSVLNRTGAFNSSPSFVNSNGTGI